MPELNLPPILWLVAFQMGLYALAWVLCGTLLGEDRQAVVHWGLFLLLTAFVMLLAGARGEPRQWLFFNGANVLSLIAFAVMRRGTEMFMRLRPNDAELLVMLALVAGTVALLGPAEEHASWRIVLAYAGQGYLVLRTMVRIRRPLQAEFGPATLWAIVVPGVLISLMLAGLAARQLVDMAHPMEMQRSTGTSYGLMYLYLGGSALFNFGFMVMLTQRLVVALRAASLRDALTGLLNRRAIDEALARQWLRRRRRDHRFAVLALDIDHFKQINDGHGHAVGDQVLAHVARLLQSQVRSTDLVARLGGEEFLVLLPDTTADEAVELAERLRETIATRPLHGAHVEVRATVSVGVALAGPADADIDAVVRRADDALYRAKAAGRNRCELALSAPAPPLRVAGLQQTAAPT